MTKTKIFKPNDLMYLGFGCHKDIKNITYDSVPHIDSKMKFQRKLKSLTKRSENISLETRFERLNWLIRGWVNYFRISKMKSFLREVDRHLRTRIRIIIWKMWKVSKARIENLVKCGYSKYEARGLVFCRRGYMFVTHSKILQNAISKERLAQPNKKKGRRGLVFALDYYLA
jgi:predicted XRE-type DNA-binding protein